MSDKNQKNIDIECILSSHEKEYSLMKIFNYIKRKVLQKSKKISSDNIDDLREQNSDNESDKTFYEKKCPSNSSRKANSVISNKSTNTETISNKSNDSGPMTKYTSKTLYRKRIKSIDYVRDNKNDNYDVVLNYQKYIPKKTFSSGTLFDVNIIKNNS